MLILLTRAFDERARSLRGPLIGIYSLLIAANLAAWAWAALVFRNQPPFLGTALLAYVSLLGISATQAAQGVSIWSIMVFPALSAAGMSLVDTTDGVLMLGAYDWAFVKPVRKLYYNLAITLVSVVVAFLVGGIEALGLLGAQLDMSGWFWDGVGTLNENFNSLGFVIIGVFIAA